MSHVGTKRSELQFTAEVAEDSGTASLSAYREQARTMVSNAVLCVLRVLRGKGQFRPPARGRAFEPSEWPKRFALAVFLVLAMAACGKRDTAVALPGTRMDPKADSIALAMQTDSIPTLVGAGDIADCGSDGAFRTGAMLDSIRGTIFITGDLAYVSEDNPHPFATCFDPAWGRHRARIRPSIGNHEYSLEGPAAYFDYFGAQAGPRPDGYYSYDLGSWHVIALNTNIPANAGSPQQTWLQADLESHLGRCTVAYMHHPRFSSGSHVDRDKLIPIWSTLQRYGVTLAIAGHDHIYERFAPLDSNGIPDSLNGVRQFVVGTGGAHRSRIRSLVRGSEVHATDSFGLIRFALLKDSYRWQFMPVKKRGFTDEGEAACHPTHAAR